MAIDLPSTTLAFIMALESITGMQIAILERKDKTEEFWARTAAILCDKTKDEWCSQDVHFMNSNTEITGQSYIIEYTPKGGKMKRVCALIPPMKGLHPSFVSSGYGTGISVDYQGLTSDEVESWFMMYHAAHCLDNDINKKEDDRAAAFATLGLSVLGGDYKFVPGQVGSSARQFAIMTGKPAAYWAAGIGERILFDLWKDETVDILRTKYSCNATSTPNNSIDTEKIKRDHDMSSTANCDYVSENSRVRQRGNVNDANLWLWMFGSRYVDKTETTWPSVGVPPKPYTPAKTFKDFNTAATYVLQTANELAR